MVTCTLNGGSNDTIGSQSGDQAHHQVGVLCRADQDEKFPNGHASLQTKLPSTVFPADNLKLDYHDHPETVSVTLYVKQIDRESLQVEFSEKNVSVFFRTRDPSFTIQYPAVDPSEDYFNWKIETRSPIEPNKCTFKLNAFKLELKLFKTVNGSWESLEAPGTNNLGKPIEKEKWISLAPKTPPPQPLSKRVEFRKADDDAETSAPVVACASRMGYTGLGNLGNTCYMNAVLQCLANCTPLKNYFLGKQFQTELNRENPLGFGGSLAVSFAVILRQLWSGQRDSIEPSQLKSLLSNKASQFSGYAQHDAQEFMAFLLDGLHEDLNRVRCKPLTSAVESDGRPDSVVADEAWRVYKKRNDSVIVDLFQGQYKSTLVCPSCRKISVTFDPFLYLALPLPTSKSCFTVTVFFAHHVSMDSPPQSAVKLTLWLDQNQRVEQLKQEIRRVCADRFSYPDSELELIQTRDGIIRRWLVDPAPLNPLLNSHDDTSLLAFEIVPSIADEPRINFAVMQRALVPLEEQTRCATCKKESADLKRCLKCFTVAYCNKNCQKDHWALIHRTTCKYKPVIIGQPFIMSLPASSLTYKRLKEAMLYYARFSVDVTVGLSNRNQEFSSSSSSGLSGTDDGDSQQPGWFVIKPIDSQGQGIGKERLVDRGDELLDFGSDGEQDESPVFLAMDWRNNERMSNYCVVANKSVETDDMPCITNGSELDNPLKLTLHHCLEQFMRPEILSREEAWYCPQCKEHREATKEMSLWRLPEILTIQLKRFSFRNLLWRDKIDQKVHFPIEQLDLAPYLSTTGSSDGAIYDLIGVVNHYGGILYGHYTAFARCPSVNQEEEDQVGWRCMDDRQVRDVSAESVVTPAAYLLLYRRRRKGSPPRATAPASPLYYSDPEEID